jgi:chaperone BCS1
MQTIWEFFEHQLASNQFFGGGLILMIGGALFAYCRELPIALWDRLKRQWLIEIDVLDRDQAFEWIDRWLAEHAYSKDRVRNLTVKTLNLDYRERHADPSIDPRPRILFSPAPGQHLLFYRGRLVILNRQRPEPNDKAGQPITVRESFSIQIFSRNRDLARQLLEDARDVALPVSDNRVGIFRASYASWHEQMKRLPRPPESVILPQGLMESLIGDVREFLTRRTWYHERGIPYRRGFLLYGPPGTGKSSAVIAVASALRMDIAILSLVNSSIDDDDLCQLLSECPPNAIVLIEDIDCVFVERKASEDKQNKLTFSGLLNGLDGVAAGEGRVLFATTNHPERLDPALVRPGRIDRRERIGHADRDQLRRLFLRFYAGVNPSMADYFANSLPENTIPMSAVQSHLVRYPDAPHLAVQQLEELLQLSRQIAAEADEREEAAEDGEAEFSLAEAI